MDKETQKQISDADRIRQTLETPGWEIIEKKLDDIILTVTDIRNLEGKTKEERLDELEKKEAAVSLLEHWVSSVKGDAINAQQMKPKEDEEEPYIINK